MKLIIFDLDNTLFDTFGQLTLIAHRHAARVLAENGFPTKEDFILKARLEISRENPRLTSQEINALVFKKYGLADPRLIKLGEDAYYNNIIPQEGLRPFPDTIPTLTKLKMRGFILALITSGRTSLQKEKIKNLGIEDYFEYIEVDDKEKLNIKTKEKSFKKVTASFKVAPKDALSVGDQINLDIRDAKKLGMLTVQMLHGRYRYLKPEDPLEIPDYRIFKISGLLKIKELGVKTNHHNYQI